jgi:hypothetical protein
MILTTSAATLAFQALPREHAVPDCGVHGTETPRVAANAGVRSVAELSPLHSSAAQRFQSICLLRQPFETIGELRTVGRP